MRRTSPRALRPKRWISIALWVTAGSAFGSLALAWALQNYGFKVVISSRFADIFRGNSAKGGLLTVILPQAEIEKLWETIEADASTQVSVDLEKRTVSYAGHSVSFEIDDYTRWRLMEGLDDIGLTMQHVDEIAKFEAKRPSFKPKTLPVK